LPFAEGLINYKIITDFWLMIETPLELAQPLQPTARTFGAPNVSRWVISIEAESAELA
jgi:hypothetical protein